MSIVAHRSAAICSHVVDCWALSSLFCDIWDKFDNLFTRSVSLLWIWLITVTVFTDYGIIGSSEAPRLLFHNLILRQLLEWLNHTLAQMASTSAERAYTISIAVINSCADTLSVGSTLIVVRSWCFQWNLGSLGILRGTCSISNRSRRFDQCARSVPTTLSIVTRSTTILLVLEWQCQICKKLRLWLALLRKLLSFILRCCFLNCVRIGSELVLVLCTTYACVENASWRSLIVMVDAWQRVRLSRPADSSRLPDVLRSGDFREARRLMVSIFSILRERLCDWSLLTAGPYLSLGDRSAGSSCRDSIISGALLTCIQTIWNSHVSLLLQVIVEGSCGHTLLWDSCIIVLSV